MLVYAHVRIKRNCLHRRGFVDEKYSFSV